MWDLLWRERRWAGLTLGFSILAASFEGLGVGLIVPLLQSLVDPQAPVLQTGLGWIDQWVLGGSAIDRLYRLSLLILLSTWIRGYFEYNAQVSSAKTIETILVHLRMQVFEQLQRVALSFYAQRRAGELLNSLTTEVQRIKALLSNGTSLIVNSLTLLAYAIALIWLSWPLSILAIGLFTALSLGLTKLIIRVKTSGQKVTQANGAFSALASELISGIRTVRAQGAEDFERTRFQKATHQVAQQSIVTSQRAALIQPLSEALATTLLVGIVVLAAQFFILTGKLSAASLLAFFFVLFRLFPLVQQVNKARGQWATLQGALTNLAQLLNPQDKPYLPLGTRHLDHFQNKIQCLNVDFSYGPDRPVLQNITLEIRRGQMIALVGASGAGKSTLADLVARFYDPTAGQILLDGYDLKEYDVKSLRQHIGIVSQDTFVFHDTVTANLTYGLSDVPTERIEWAANQANALAFIHELPQGFATVLGDRGVNLSGGQRQRLAIARALLRDPEILILDEATSALDSVSEQLVQASLERLMEGRTVIVIAHRLATVEKADWVVVLEAGQIQEQGTYGDLLAQKGQLWRYYTLQTGLRA